MQSLVLALIVVLALLLSGCPSSAGLLKDSGEVAPTPYGHAKLCAEQKDMPGCPK